MHPPRLLSASLFVSLLVSAAACTSGGTEIDDNPELVFENDESFVVTDFRKVLQSYNVEVVGVTIAPDTGRRYILDSARGIYEVDSEGAMTVVRSLADFPDPNEVIQSEFTDIAALGGERFALTARNEGYLLDLAANTMQRHFCYLPDDLPEGEMYQLTQSVTFDPISQKIYAQPQTFDLESDSVIASSIGMFGADDGTEQTWFPLSDVSFVAGAIAMVAEGELLLANGDTISRYDFATQVHGQPVNLDSYKIGRLSGLAVDQEAETLLLVDGARDALLELPLSILD